MSWNTTPVATAVAVVRTTITVNGSIQDITDAIGDSFQTTVVEAARNGNMGKFRVFLNGSEINPADAPTEITAGMAIELRPFDVAG